MTERTKQRIVAAAEFWLASHPDDAQCFIRFDVILVAPGKLPRHIANAFDADALIAWTDNSSRPREAC